MDGYILNHRKNWNMIAVASNKSGVGKTWFASTLAHALSLLKQKTLFFDGDLGLLNINAQLGLTGEEGLADVLSARKTLNQVICHYDKTNFDVISGKSGSMSLVSIPIGRLQLLSEDLSIVSTAYHKVILDMSAGVDKSVRILSGMAGRLIVLCTEGSASLTEAYDFIKIMHEQYPKLNIGIVVNQADSLREGQRTYDTLLAACHEFLQISPPLLGIVRFDTRVRDSIRNQTGILSRYPTSEASEDIINIAKRLLE